MRLSSVLERKADSQHPRSVCVLYTRVCGMSNVMRQLLIEREKNGCGKFRSGCELICQKFGSAEQVKALTANVREHCVYS